MSEYTDDEIEVLQQSLAMYAAYLRYAKGEPDSTAESMARDFYERRHGVRWEEDAERFANAHNRPMDLADVSPVDWYERSENIK